MLIFLEIENTYFVNQWQIGVGKINLIFTPDGLGPSTFCRKMESTRLVKEEMNGNVFVSRLCRHFFQDSVLFPIG